MIFGFLLAIAFHPYIWGGTTSPRWALLAVALPVLIAFQSPKHFTSLHLIGLAFMAWSLFTLLWTVNRFDGVDELIKFVILGIAFVYGSRLESLRGTFAGLAIGLTVSSLIITTSLKDYLPHEVVSIRLGGLFSNPNMLAEAAALTLVGCIGFRLWALIPGLLPAVVFTGSRGALLGIVVAFGTWLWSKSRFAASTLASIVLVIAVLALVFDYHAQTFIERLHLWSETLAGITLAGHGLGSFYTLFPALTVSWDMAEIRPDHAHNDALEILFETGIVGLGLYCCFIGLAFSSADQVGRCLLAAFIAISMFAFPSHLPVTAFIFAVVAGHAAVRRRPLFVITDRSRMALYPRLAGASDKRLAFERGGPALSV